MYVLNGKHTWAGIQSQLVGVCVFASAHPMKETVKASCACGLKAGEIEFHLLTDMESDLVYICLHPDGLCIQHNQHSDLAEKVFNALRGYLVAAH